MYKITTIFLAEDKCLTDDEILFTKMPPMYWRNLDVKLRTVQRRKPRWKACVVDVVIAEIVSSDVERCCWGQRRKGYSKTRWEDKEVKKKIKIKNLLRIKQLIQSSLRSIIARLARVGTLNSRSGGSRELLVSVSESGCNVIVM